MLRDVAKTHRQYSGTNGCVVSPVFSLHCEKGLIKRDWLVGLSGLSNLRCRRIRRACPVLSRAHIANGTGTDPACCKSFRKLHFDRSQSHLHQPSYAMPVSLRQKRKKPRQIHRIRRGFCFQGPLVRELLTCLALGSALELVPLLELAQFRLLVASRRQRLDLHLL